MLMTVIEVPIVWEIEVIPTLNCFILFLWTPEKWEEASKNVTVQMRLYIKPKDFFELCK